MLGKYSTNVVLPKTKAELPRQINALGKVEIKVIEPVKHGEVGRIREVLCQFKNYEVSVVVLACSNHLK